MCLSVFTLLFSLVAALHTVIPTQAEADTALFRVKRTWWGGGVTTVMVRRFVLALGAILIATGCTAKWVHPDSDADWDAAYAECSLRAEAVGSGEMHEQAMEDCLKAKGWDVRKPRRPGQQHRSRRPIPRLYCGKPSC